MNNLIAPIRSRVSPAAVSFAIALTLSLTMLAACGDDAADTEPSPSDATTSTTAASGDDSGEAQGDDDPADSEAPLGGGSYPIAELTVEIEGSSLGTLVYNITCLGDTATLAGDWDQSADTIGDIAADTMCTRLADPAVQERLQDGQPVDQACTEIYGSDETALITGTLNDAEINNQFHRSDGCGIDDWDGLMQGVLPTVA